MRGPFFTGSQRRAHKEFAVAPAALTGFYRHAAEGQRFVRFFPREVKHADGLTVYIQHIRRAIFGEEHLFCGFKIFIFAQGNGQIVRERLPRHTLYGYVFRQWENRRLARHAIFRVAVDGVRKVLFKVRLSRFALRLEVKQKIRHAVHLHFLCGGVQKCRELPAISRGLLRERRYLGLLLRRQKQRQKCSERIVFTTEIKARYGAVKVAFRLQPDRIL